MRADLKLARRLLALAGPYRGWLALGALCATLTQLAGVGLMAVAGWFIAAMALAGVAGAPINYFLPAALIRAFAILRTGGRYVERVVTHEATFRLLAQLRTWFFRRIEPLAPARLEHRRSGDLLERIQADIDTLQNAYLRLLVPFAVGIASALVAAIVLVHVIAQAAMPVMVLMLVAGAALPVAMRRLGEAPGSARIEARAALRMAVIDGVQGMAELRVYGAAQAQARRIHTLTQALNAQQLRLAHLSGLSAAIVGLCASGAMWAVALEGVVLVSRGTLMPAALPMLALFVLASFDAIGPLPGAMQQVGETFAAARRVFELVDATPEVAEPKGGSPTPGAAGITMRGVRMRYGADEAWALDGIDLELRPGRRIAVVGPSGAGKSSIVRLLLRFREYQEGAVHFGGHDLRSYRGEDLRARIAVVAQDTWLFDTTILDNLRIANPRASDADVFRAARAAQIHDFIVSLPEGYRTCVGEAGIKVSGGQARRIAIARALLKDAPVLLLDEPTEGLDPQTGQALVGSIETLMAGRSVLVITHRLAHLGDRVDEVLVLEQGRIVERGTPAELLRRGGRYARHQDHLALPGEAC
ncbi:MAG TPA: thiol reductant ABC exporter subunit CydC [Casimicrobiaceae bacterium]|nr:thiol reductant ABC exporter subunit CydC [Casimicrobiaceae bacterium]